MDIHKGTAQKIAVANDETWRIEDALKVGFECVAAMIDAWSTAPDAMWWIHVAREIHREPEVEHVCP